MGGDVYREGGGGQAGYKEAGGEQQEEAAEYPEAGAVEVGEEGGTDFQRTLMEVTLTPL